MRLSPSLQTSHPDFRQKAIYVAAIHINDYCFSEFPDSAEAGAS